MEQDKKADSLEQLFPRLFEKDTFRLKELEGITSVKVRQWRLELERGKIKGFNLGSYWLVRGEDAANYITGGKNK